MRKKTALTRKKERKKQQKATAKSVAEVAKIQLINPKPILDNVPLEVTKRTIINEPDFEIVEYSPQMRLINSKMPVGYPESEKKFYKRMGYVVDNIYLAFPYVQYGRFGNKYGRALFVGFSNEPANIDSEVWPAPLPGTYGELMICLMYHEFDRQASLQTLIDNYYFSSFYGLRDGYLEYSSLKTIDAWRRLTPQTALLVESWGYTKYPLSDIPNTFARYGLPH